MINQGLIVFFIGIILLINYHLYLRKAIDNFAFGILALLNVCVLVSNFIELVAVI